VDAPLKLGPAAAANGAGKSSVAVSRRSPANPFDPKSDQDLSVDQLNEILAPKTGALWTFYDDKLKQNIGEARFALRCRAGERREAVSSLLAFFNRALPL